MTLKMSGSLQAIRWLGFTINYKPHGAVYAVLIVMLSKRNLRDDLAYKGISF